VYAPSAQSGLKAPDLQSAGHWIRLRILIVSVAVGLDFMGFQARSSILTLRPDFQAAGHWVRPRISTVSVAVGPDFMGFLPRSSILTERHSSGSSQNEIAHEVGLHRTLTYVVWLQLSFEVVPVASAECRE